MKNAQVLALVPKLQKAIRDKMESQTVESVQRKNDVSLLKALQKLADMIDSRSQKKQMKLSSSH